MGYGDGHGLLLLPDVRLLPPDGAHVGDGEPVHVADRDVHGQHGRHVLHVQRGLHARSESCASIFLGLGIRESVFRSNRSFVVIERLIP